MKLRRLLLSAFGTTLVVVVHAQDTGGTLVGDTLATVSVRGLVRGRDLSGTVPEYTLTAKSMERMGVTDIGGALRRMPGVTLRDYGGAGGMKTVSVRGLGAQHTAVVYDGVALGDCQTGQADVARYSLDDVAEMALVVGDNDDIFQPARNMAAAASLHIGVAGLPSDDRQARMAVQVRTGSWGLINPFVRLDKNISERLGFGITGDYTYAENDYPYKIVNVTQETRGRRNNSRMNAAHVEINMAYRPRGGGIMRLKAYCYDNARQLPGMVHYYVNESCEQLHDRNCFVQFNWRGDIARKLKAACAAKLDYGMTDYRNPAYEGNIQDHLYRQREAYATASLLYEPDGHTAISYSADYAFNTLSGSDVADYRDPFRHTILQSLAAKWRTARIKAVARLMHAAYLNGSRVGGKANDAVRLSPSVSLSWRMLEGERLFLRLAYKEIFRSPSFNELYYEHYGSTNLRPERTEQINAGMTWRHDYGRASVLTLTADVYHNNVRDKIVAIPYNMFIWTNINLGSVKAEGADVTATLEHRLNDRHTLAASGNYTMQKVTNRTRGDAGYGKQVAYTPEHSGGCSVAWENPWANVSLCGAAASSRWANNEHYQGTMLKGYADLGMALYRSVEMKGGTLAMRLDVKNILGRHYEIVRFYPMPGRSWQMTLKYTF